MKLKTLAAMKLRNHLHGTSGLRPIVSAVRLLGLTRLAIMSLSACAEIPVPDNLLYGVINLGGAQIMAGDSSFVVEARRFLGGEPIASYRMGSDPAAADFYSLRLMVEQQAPVQNPSASLAGQPLYLIVRNDLGIQTQLVHQVAAPGTVQRIDFGAPTSDSDGDGLPDAWELASLGVLGQNGGQDFDGDGHSNLAEYLAGTHPGNPNDTLRLSYHGQNQRHYISFLARSATGSGYEGRTRYYALQSSTNLQSALWSPVPGYTNLTGANQTVTCEIAPNQPPVYFRCHVTLGGPDPG